MDRSALARKPMTELKDIAAHLDMRGYQKLRKADLIDAIINSGDGGNQDADGGNGAGPSATREGSEDGARKVLPPSRDDERGEETRGGKDTVVTDDETEREAPQTESRGEPATVDHDRGQRSKKIDATQSEPHRSESPQSESDEAGAAQDDDDDGDDDAVSRKRRNRRDRRKRNRDRQSEDNQAGRGGGAGDANDPGEVRAGVLDILPEGYGFLRTTGYLPGERDVYVSQGQIRKHGLRRGDVVQGPIRQQRSNEKVPALHHVQKVNGEELEDGQVADRDAFDELPVRAADSRIDLSDSQRLTARLIDLTAPIAEGQRTLVLTPPRADGAAFLRELAGALSAARPDSHLMSVLVDAPAEDVAAAAEADGEIISSTFDQPAEDHIGVAELAVERARRLVELGHDVIVILHSLTRLARAYGVTAGNSHKVVAPNVDAASLYPAKRFMASARNIDEGGSLTILATVLTDTGSAHDEVIAAEFRRVASGEIVLQQDVTVPGAGPTPPLSLDRSFTKTTPALHDDQTSTVLAEIRDILKDLPADQVLDRIMTALSQTASNGEFVDQFKASDLMENR